MTRRCTPLLLLLLIMAGTATAEDWPHWRGPQRNDHSDEPSGWTGSDWPLTETWTANVGEGSTSPVVVGDRLYTFGWGDDRETVVCLDVATGKTLWTQAYDAPRFGRHAVGDQGLYFGPTSSPEYDPDTGWLYTLGCDGDLVAWNTRDGGAVVWKRNLYDDYGMPQRPGEGERHSNRRDYGYTTAPLVSGDSLLVEVGAPSGTVRAFDKRTGAERWTSEFTGFAGHSGAPVLMTVEEIPCLVVFAQRELVVMRLDAGHEGKTIAVYPWESSYANNILTPAVSGNSVLISSFHSHGRRSKPATCRLRITLDGAERVWEQPIGSHIGSPVISEGRIYMAGPQFYCLDWETGETVWSGAGFNYGASCLLTQDDRLILLGNRGQLLLVDSDRRSPGTYHELAARKTLTAHDCWPHVVLSGGRLFCKDVQGNLLCLEIGK